MSEAKSSAISEILRSEFSQIDDSIYQYIEGDFEPDLCFYFFCGVRELFPSTSRNACEPCAFETSEK
jgi:hypothetical protein